MPYRKYKEMDFKKEYSCPYTSVEVGTCWCCQSFNYCLNRKEMLASIGLNPEYTPTPLSWYTSKDALDPRRLDDVSRKQHLYYNDAGNTYF